MRATGRNVAVVLSLLVLFSCAHEEPSARERRPDALFDAGHLWLARSVSEGKLLSLDPEKAQHDLLYAEAFSSAHPPTKRWAERQTSARGLLSALKAASAEIPPTPAELAEQKARLWAEVERPVSHRAIEVFIPVERFSNDQDEAALADRIAAATKNDDDPRTFAGHADAEKAEGISVMISILPPVTSDYRIVPLEQNDDPRRDIPKEVVDALVQLPGPGAKSSVIGSKKGFHLLFLVESYPAVTLTGLELAERLSAAVYEVRIAPELGRLRKELRSQHPVSVMANASAAMALSWAAP